MKYILAVLTLSLSAFAQCSLPVPGSVAVCVSWAAVTANINGGTITGVTYNLYRATTAGGESFTTPLNPTPLTTTFYSDTTVLTTTPVTTYYYKIIAVAGGIQSAPSSEVSAQVPVPPSTPLSPSANPI